MALIQLKNKNCLCIGEGSITRFVMELLQKNGYSIVACLTKDQLLTIWCEANKIRVYEWPNSSNQIPAEIGLDYQLIVSAGNAYKVPSSLFHSHLDQNNSHQVIGINIHDGPLDSLLGFNTPSWALMQGKTQHQIHWHLMTNDLYQGDILHSETIDIAPDETATTLNAKCFAAALSSLEEILQKFSNEGIDTIPNPQTKLTQEHYFSLKRRPDHFGFLDPKNSCQTAINIARGLHFGHYSNPLCLAKVFIGKEILEVVDIQTIANETNTNVDLGAILKTHDKHLEVNWLDGILQLEVAAFNSKDVNVSHLKGQSILLPSLKSSINTLAQHFGQHEQWWIKTLRKFTALNFPYIDIQQQTKSKTSSKELDFFGKNEHKFYELLTHLFAYLARVSDQEDYSIPVVFDRHYANKNQESELAYRLGIQRAALNISFDFGQPLTSQASKVKLDWQQLLTVGTFSLDLPARYKELHHWQTQADQPYCLFISDESDENLENTFTCFLDTAFGIIISPENNSIRIFSNGHIIKPIDAIYDEILVFSQQSSAEIPLAHLSLVTEKEAKLLQKVSRGPEGVIGPLLLGRLQKSFELNPSKTAVIHRNEQMTYGDLQQQIQQVICALETSNVQPGEFVGIMMPRCLALLPCLLGVMAYGAACVPMDPLYPQDRLDYVIENSQMKLLLCLEPHEHFHNKTQQMTWSKIVAAIPEPATTILNPLVESKSLAYMLYTSGSSGKPKGVMVEHGNLANFFAGMDRTVPLAQDSVWLAVTSISFDISLLELLWTLTRGITTVLYDGQDIQQSSDHLKNENNKMNRKQNALDFGLFFWNISNDKATPGPHQYELLLKAAEFGDQNGFNAVWTPERHFGDFGGLYPNPAITSAAVAARTQNIHIRAGSCVFPLHHPVRIAEDWSVIDNISNGRVGLAAAPGWMPNDFVIKPENHAQAKDKMFESLDIVRRLWRGDAVDMLGPKGLVPVTTLPRPVQKELPVWLTTGGNPENFKQAGTMGIHLLTHLLGQDMDELATKIKIYRQAWQDAGHKGQGKITVMLHTFIADTQDQARDIVRQPMKNYLKTALFLVKAAAWDWPLFKKLSENQSQNLDDFFATISAEDLDALLEFAFERYFKSSGLFGSVEDGITQAKKLYAIGVNEIGCLIDFGIETTKVLEHLPHLRQVLQEANQQLQQQMSNAEMINHFGVAPLISKHKVSHLQVTPSMARLFLSDPQIAKAMESLDTVLIGGEALPLDLAKTIKSIIQGPLLNMYGPTETTIWSSVYRMDQEPQSISLGQPILNTQISIVDRRRQPLPAGAIGELFIGGAGVVRGYWQRPDLTADKFLQDYPAYSSSEKVYATGDLARYLPDGRLVFLGRNDFQVKIRGYRIELGEIETILLKQPGIAEAVVHPVSYAGAEPRLIGYYTLDKYSLDQSQSAKITSQHLKQALADSLPSFMIPNLFVELESFPLTPNAKIDRKALPVPQLDTNQSKSLRNENEFGKENASELELQVLAIWQDILGTADFGIEDNFFDHGGHSLLVVDVMTRVRPLFEKQIKLIDLFRYPQVRKLVKHLSSDSEAGDTSMVANAQNRAAARRAARKR